MRLGGFDRLIPCNDHVGQYLAPPLLPGLPGWIVDVCRVWQLVTGFLAKPGATAVAIAHPVPLPAIGEDRVDIVVAGNFLDHVEHENVVVVAIGTRHPDIGEGPVPARLAVLVDGDPFGMRVGGLLMDRVWIDPRHHVHVERTCPLDEPAEGIGITNVFAHMVERYLARIVRDIAARAQAGSV